MFNYHVLYPEANEDRRGGNLWSSFRSNFVIFRFLDIKNSYAGWHLYITPNEDDTFKFEEKAYDSGDGTCSVVIPPPQMLSAFLYAFRVAGNVPLYDKSLPNQRSRALRQLR